MHSLDFLSRDRDRGGGVVIVALVPGTWHVTRGGPDGSELFSSVDSIDEVQLRWWQYGGGAVCSGQQGKV